MGKLKLTVNDEKTRICKVQEGEFDFLGYTFGQMYSARTGKAYLGHRPSRKSIKRMVENIHRASSCSAANSRSGPKGDVSGAREESPSPDGCKWSGPGAAGGKVTLLRRPDASDEGVRRRTQC